MAPEEQTLIALDEDAWKACAADHRARLAPTLDPYVAQRKRGVRQPVLDFLFEYYGFRKRRLLTWSPGIGRALVGEAALALEGKTHRRHPLAALGGKPMWRRVETAAGPGLAVDPPRYPAKRREAARWMRDLLVHIGERPPFFGCSGMHEWAMVYRQAEVRHGQLPLRLAPEAIAEFVDQQPIQCSHYDAFRFFTPDARPLNRLQPGMDDVLDLEQPGCLHTNMDLYRWAAKLWPWIDGELLADAFLLAARIREVDMRASPYDLADAGYAPICIETAEGRRDYQARQRAFELEARPLRTRLIGFLDRLIDGFDGAREATPAR